MRRSRLALLTLVLSACQGQDVLKTPAPAGSAALASPSAGARLADLEAAWRESVRYRSAHLAMADNRGSLEQDIQRSARMLEAVEAFKRVPVAADPVVDAKAVEAAVQAYLKGLKLKGDVRVKTLPAPQMPPAEIATTEGLHYTDAQLIGQHEVEVVLGQGLETGRHFTGDLNALGRLFISVGARIGPDGEATIRGHVPFFRDLKPVRFTRSTPPFAEQVNVLNSALATPEEAAQLGLIRENLLLVEAVSKDLELSLAHQATLKISTGRFRAYGQAIERYNKASWGATLSAGLP